ncbi:uncharacterized protein LY79DRAFT_163404 [Colletotrichum navitas]|uniref:Uncharacterized protein n=1 Tax=Colletotrichum navitas TaxID=681940 RepID=A0AAD8V747_9PEZI|nr:uncharacterized protein LY79DRAFT_163404 [Colletotrichum navitas]KAK1594261.1 hypothetical protein LY79DRAFT_163404 [Colletotrichum navitas]
MPCMPPRRRGASDGRRFRRVWRGRRGVRFPRWRHREIGRDRERLEGLILCAGCSEFPGHMEKRRGGWLCGTGCMALLLRPIVWRERYWEHSAKLQTDVLGKHILENSNASGRASGIPTTSKPPRRPVDNEGGQGAPPGSQQTYFPGACWYGLSLECVDVARPPPNRMFLFPSVSFTSGHRATPNQGRTSPWRSDRFNTPCEGEGKRGDGRAEVAAESVIVLWWVMRPHCRCRSETACPGPIAVLFYVRSPRQLPGGSELEFLRGALSVTLHLIDSSSSFNFTLELTNLGT